MAGTPCADRRLRVLVVDDSRDTADTFATLLGMYGHDSQPAYHGQAGLDAARSFRPDVAFIDLAMPGMDGCELARRLRLLPEAATCILVSLTGYGDPDHHHLIETAGFTIHLMKPVDPPQLRNLLAVLAREKVNCADGRHGRDTMPPS